MSTPHINAKKGDIAKLVIMPGDPLRAKFIADNFLENVKQFNEIRNMFGYSGEYQGNRVSIMGSGMGQASIGIYAYELYNFYNVEAIIRVGSAGSYIEDLKLYDIVLVDKAFSESSFAKVYSNDNNIFQYPSKKLNENLLKSAKNLNIDLRLDTIHSTDVFYRTENSVSFSEINKNFGCSCVDMESFTLFHLAWKNKKEAACLLTISDSLITNENISAQERQLAFKNMIKISLDNAKYYQ